MAIKLVQLDLNYIAAGQLCTNVTHWAGDNAQADLWLLAKRFVTAVTAPTAGTAITDVIRAILSEDAFVSSATARVLKPTPGTKAITVYATTDLPGTWADEIYAQSVAGVMKSITASGPDLTGRTFFPAVPEEAIVDGRFSDDYRTAFNAVMSGFADGITSADGLYEQQIYKRSTGAWEFVTNRQLNPNPGTIRGRLLPV